MHYFKFSDNKLCWCSTNVQCSLCLWYMYFVGEQTFSYCCLLTAAYLPLTVTCMRFMISAGSSLQSNKCQPVC